MIAKAGEDALMADFLEYYHCAEWRAFPIETSAALAFHLPAESRVKRALAGRTWSMETLLLAAVADRLSNLIWMLSEDGAKGRNRPESIYAALSGEKKEKEAGKDDLQKFASGDEFMKRWKELTNN